MEEINDIERPHLASENDEELDSSPLFEQEEIL